MAGIKRTGYRKPVRTNKPGIADALRKGSIDDLMTKFNASIRTAKKEQTKTTMVYEARVQLNDMKECDLFECFIANLMIHRGDRSDPFAITPESLKRIDAVFPATQAKTAAAMKFDELVPADDPPEATAGPTWAPHTKPITEDINAEIAKISPEEYPTEDDAVNAFKANVAKRTTDQWKALFATYFGAQRVKDIPAEMRAAFIAEASRDL